MSSHSNATFCLIIAMLTIGMLYEANVSYRITAILYYFDCGPLTIHMGSLSPHPSGACV